MALNRCTFCFTSEKMFKVEALRWTVWKEATKFNISRWKKMRKAPKATDLHKKNRMTWCFDQIIFTPEESKKVVLSDEKKFLIDGTDGNA